MGKWHAQDPWLQQSREAGDRDGCRIPHDTHMATVYGGVTSTFVNTVLVHSRGHSFVVGKPLVGGFSCALHVDMKVPYPWYVWRPPYMDTGFSELAVMTSHCSREGSHSMIVAFSEGNLFAYRVLSPANTS